MSEDTKNKILATACQLFADGGFHGVSIRDIAKAVRESGFTGRSREPKGVVLVILPTGEVGEYWPLVNP